MHIHKNATLQATVLLVEDDIDTALPLTIHLQEEGFRTLYATDGVHGLAFARTAQPDLVLLDTMPPHMEGLTLCQALRQESDASIIMLGNQDHPSDRVLGLEMGADDYLVQPFAFRELVARMQAVLRRRNLTPHRQTPPPYQLVVGDIVLDPRSHQVWRADQLVALRQREFDLLRVLMENAGQALQRHDLLDRVWGTDWVGDPRTLDVHICWLRRKLEDDPSNPQYIRTVHGYGYRCIDPTIPATNAA